MGSLSTIMPRVSHQGSFKRVGSGRNIGAAYVRQRARTAVAHDQLEFGLQDGQDLVHAGLAERPKAPQHGTPDADGLCAQCKCLEDIGAAADTAIHEHGDVTADRGHDFRQGFNRRAAGFG